MQLSQRQPTGGTLRQHLQAAAAATGRADPRLLQTVPDGVSALWETYCELSTMRPAGMGVSAIPGAEYESWQRLSGVQLTPWEVDTLKAMDRAALGAWSDAQAKKGTS
jgi:hypothetical protein